MALGSVYGIEKYSDSAETKLNKDYTRFQAIRTALLFGYKINKISDDRIILYNMMHKPATGLVVDKNYPYAMFKIDMKNLTNNYNASLKKFGSHTLPYDYYTEEQPMSEDKVEQAYPYAQDPIIKAKLLKDKMGQRKGNEFSQEVDENMQSATIILQEVSWGKDVAAALDYFWKNNKRNLVEEAQQRGE